MGWETFATLQDIKQECLTEKAITKMEESRKEDIAHPVRTKWVPIVEFSMFVSIVFMVCATAYMMYLRTI